MRDKPVITIVLDKRHKLASGKFSVKLRATFQIAKGDSKRWIQKLYTCDNEDGSRIEATEKDFNRIMGKPATPEQKKIRLRIKALEGKATEILTQNNYVTPELFDRRYSGGSLYGVIPFFTKYIDELKELQQDGTARVYTTARNSITAFAGEPSFLEINEAWIKKYVAWMRGKKRYKEIDGKKVLVSQGSAVTSIAINLRCLRKIFNDAIKDHYASADYYPFGRRRYVIQEERKPKKALSEEQKNLVLKFETKDAAIRKAVDYWIFSYFCNGSNFSDLARLQYKDIRDGVIRLDRTKTLNTVKVRKKIEIPVRLEMKKIIAAHGNKSLDPDAFVFPVLVKDLTRKQEKFRIEDWIDETNAELRKVAVDLGFDFRFSTMTARHTFATISLRKGADKSFIQEAMGHQSMATTENYLDGFDIETKKTMSDRL